MTVVVRQHSMSVMRVPYTGVVTGSWKEKGRSCCRIANEKAVSRENFTTNKYLVVASWRSRFGDYGRLAD